MNDLLLRREKKTVEKMIGLYCRAHHRGASTPCDECAALMNYARERTARCRYREMKPVCSECSVHCYKPEMRERMKRVMRYAGPRMIWHHPLLALRHLVRKRRVVHPARSE